jgi:protein-export membrane protein SecD
MVDQSRTYGEALSGVLPPGAEILPYEVGANAPEPGVVVRRRIEISGENLADARMSNDPQTGEPVVSIRFDSQGARRFGEITTRNVNKPFAIVLDDKVLSAPNINEPILGGSAQISGGFTAESANNLAIMLRNGALPAPLKIEEQRTVGAELGADAVEAGRISTMVAFITILTFMVLAYGLLFGGISVVALVINGLLIIAAMSATQATLTLPGIAGLILTLAVAVDANVLIYERMRDEVRAGRPVLSAMEAGFSRAMETIIDANLTTLIAAAIMFFFGAGPVRGFAWTLSIGVFTSVLTAVLVTQVLLAVWYRTARPKTLPIA